MSTDRRWNQRLFRLEESTTQNNGARTIFIEHITPGTSVPPHYHSLFSETFDLISGSVSVYSTDKPDLEALNASEQQLEIGRKVTVEPGRYHMYRVGSSGEEETVLRVIVAPGDSNFERMLMILNGLARDGKIEELSDSAMLMAVVMDLSDAHIIGPVKDMLDGVKREKETEILELKRDLLRKYDTEEALQDLLRKET
jgi:hypothetical protein